MASRAGAAAIFALLGLVVAGPAAAQSFEVAADFAACGDPSFQTAVTDGITLGIAPAPPYTSLDPATKLPEGIDVEINRAALGWMGVTTIKYEVAPFGQLIPMLLSHRIDAIATNIHATPERLKVIGFTGPAWWYGPAVVVNKTTEPNLTAFADLRGKAVGAIVGSAADEYLRHIGATVQPFQAGAEEFAAIAQRRVDAVLEDDVEAAEYLKANPAAPIRILDALPVPEEIITSYGYGYARYGLRKDDCSLRAAYTQALSEMRGNGSLLHILKRHGLGLRNVSYVTP
jgi:polar amino acid transport system substrate-binding protein